MSGMIERVARAIANDQQTYAWKLYVSTARAAIEAMEKPADEADDEASSAHPTRSTLPL